MIHEAARVGNVVGVRFALDQAIHVDVFHRVGADDFCPRQNLNSVQDYSSSSVGVVCRVSNLKDGIFSKRFELEG